LRLGIVQGRVVLSVSVPELVGTVFLIVEPLTSEDLQVHATRGSGKALVIADHLGPCEGQIVAFVEGREGANPYWPNDAPVDAYCSLVVDEIDYHPATPKPQSLAV
jgi:microcompartment protein CcmK/EutM